MLKELMYLGKELTRGTFNTMTPSKGQGARESIVAWVLLTAWIFAIFTHNTSNLLDWAASLALGYFFGRQNYSNID